MRLIRALVVDDERYAREELLYLLESYTDIHVISDVARGEDAVILAIEKSPDVIFLDINMPVRNGLEIARSLQKIKNRPYIIFTTAHAEYAAEAFRVNALDYLLKPYQNKQLDEAINKLRTKLIQPSTRELNNHLPSKLPVQKNDDIRYIHIKDIAYLYPQNKVSVIVTANEQFTYNYSLKEAEKQLKDYGFFRTHRSFLVNLAFVKRMTPWFNGAYELELNGIEENVSVSRNYAKAFMQRLQIY